MKKQILNICLAMLFVCFLFGIDVQATPVSGYYPSITLNVPKMSQYPQACGIACMGQGEAYFFDQTDRTYSSSAVYSLVKSYNKASVSANWGNVGWLKKGAASESAYLNALYEQLASGYPAIVFRRDSSGGTHYGTVYAYTGSATTLTRAGFKVVSTNQSLAYVSKESLSTFLTDATPIDVYDSDYPNKYKYIVRRSGIPNPSSLVSGITFAINHPPYQHEYGTTQVVLGTVSSNYNLTKVTVGVYDLSGNVKFSASATPNAKYYNIYNLDSKMTFKSLAKGNYDYIVTATDSSGATKTYTWRFKVVSSAVTATTITFTYNPNGASGTIANQTVAYGGTLTPASASGLVRTGYTFQGYAGYRSSDKKYYTTTAGWQTQASITANGYTKKAYMPGTSYVINSSWVLSPYVDNQFILAAMWKANTYTITYKSNGGSGSMSNTAVTYGTTETLRNNTFTKSGYKFTGWNLYNENSGKWLYTNGTVKAWYASGKQPSGYSLAVCAAGTVVSDLDTADEDVIQAIAVWEEDEAWSLPFTDVAEGSWYYDAVVYVYENDIMKGTSDTLFSPGGSLSRAQFSTIVYRLNGSPVVDEYTKVFPDVPDGQWYTDAVLWAYQEGIIKGYGNGNFGPSDMITREQMALMMYRYANYMGYDTSTSSSRRENIAGISNIFDILNGVTNSSSDMLNSFSDADRISDYAVEAVNWALYTGIITGKSSSGQVLIAPQDNTTRAECAIIVQRFLDYYN